MGYLFKELLTQQEYFHLPPKRVYKECNRYRIASTTLEDFGLKIINNDPKNATNIQGVWSHDRMSITAQCEDNIITGYKSLKNK